MNAKPSTMDDLTLKMWRKLYRRQLTEMSGIDCSTLSDEALDKVAHEMAHDEQGDDD